MHKQTNKDIPCDQHMKFSNDLSHRDVHMQKLDYPWNDSVYVCMYVCIYVLYYIYIYMHVLQACMHVGPGSRLLMEWFCLCMYVCMYVCMYAHKQDYPLKNSFYICMYVCMYVCICTVSINYVHLGMYVPME